MFDCSLEELRRIAPTLKTIRAIPVVSVGDKVENAREAVSLVRSISNIG